MSNRTFNGTTLRRREWVRYWSGIKGVELLEASFEQHVYERHIHDTYAIGVTRHGVQRFWCRGATHDSLPGNVIVIPPGGAHDGESGTEGGYTYRMFYVSIERMTELVSEAFDRPASSIQLQRCCVLSEPALARELDAAWKAMSTQPTSLATDELFSGAFARLDVRHNPNAARIGRLGNRALERAQDYLREHVYVRLDDVAAVASMSRFQLTRQFQKAYGCPCMLTTCIEVGRSEARAPNRRPDRDGRRGSWLCRPEPSASAFQGRLRDDTR